SARPQRGLDTRHLHRRPSPVIEVGVPESGPRNIEVVRTLPQRVGVLPLRDTVTFPEMLIPLNVGQPRSIELINDVLRGDRSIVMVASRNPEVEAPGPGDLYSVGVLGVVARMIRVPDGTLRVLIQGALRLKTEEKQALLEELDVGLRLRRLSEILARELEVVAIGSRIQSQVQSELEKGQREYFLRQQLKAIQEELGEADEIQAEVNELRRQLESIELPEPVRKQVDRELARLDRLQPAMAEYGVVRGYLEWIASLPWDKST